MRAGPAISSVIAAAAVILAVTAAFAFPRAALGDATATSTAAETTAQKQQALEDQLQQLEGQIDQYESQITVDEKQGNTLSGEIDTLNAQISKVELQIKATNLTLQELNGQIADTQSQIAITQSSIADEQVAIGSILKTVYENDAVSNVELFLENPELSTLWDEVKNETLVEASLNGDVAQLSTLTGELQSQNDQLATSKSAAASAQAYETSEAQQIAATKNTESQLLTATKGEESAYQTLVAQTKQTAAQVRNQIFQLLGGGQLTFGQAYQYAQVASQATGVDPALILAVLDRESALGENVGQCSYQTAMSPSNIPVFLQIVQQLGLNPADMMVSCANADGAYGGAMGPAQFEPSTWELYAASIASITGDSPPSPWNNADAFMGTALYLKDAMTGCEASYSAQVDIERCTAAKYYAGSAWQNYLWTYGEAIVEQAQAFTQDIATITG